MTIAARFHAALLILATFTATAFACLWDSDTLRMEAKRFPGLVEVLTGRFEREPPRYYEMRLERVARLIADQPDNLEAYDDAAVACDRLGRSDEAIAWMARKLEALSRADPSAAATREHTYRYHANLGTFHAHRWIRDGAPRDNLADLQRGEAEIAEAIRLNPDAHFGREKYQLAALRWLIELPPAAPYWQPTFVTPLLPDNSDPNPSAAFDDAIKGLSGLIVMGDAWQSVDVHWALMAVVNLNGDSTLATLADQRIGELLESGRKSFHKDFDPETKSLRGQFRGSNRYEGATYDRDRAEIEAYFAAARKSATQWADARTGFMEAKFDKGEHPDITPDFWEGWEETSPPALPYSGRRTQNMGIVAGLLAVVLVTIIGIVRRIRRKRRLQTPSPV